jgi:hypothetical protein
LDGAVVADGEKLGPKCIQFWSVFPHLELYSDIQR